MTVTNFKVKQSFLENELPIYLQESLEKMKRVLEKQSKGVTDPLWDCWWMELNSSINVAEVEQEISSSQAWYLREKYLGMEKPSSC